MTAVAPQERASLLYVGPPDLFDELPLAEDTRARAIRERDLDRALRRLASDSPRLVVCAAGLEDCNPLDFVAVTRTCYPHIPTPIIALDSDNSPDDIVVNRWQPARDDFVNVVSPRRDLEREIAAMLAIRTAAIADQSLDEITRVGRNEYIENDDGSFNVQTEVRLGDRISITTMIFSGGTIVHNAVQHCALDEPDVTNTVNRLAGLQHYEAVTRARDGGYRSGETP